MAQGVWGVTFVTLLEPGIPGSGRNSLCTWGNRGPWGAEPGPDLGPPDPMALGFSPLQMARWRSPNQSPGEWAAPVKPCGQRASEEG